MAKIIRTSYDFESTGSLLNAIIQVSGSDPVSPTPADGQIYYNSGTNSLRTYNGATWDEYNIGAGVTDGDKGDITVSASGATWTIDGDAVTYAKIQNVVADNVFLGNNSGAGAIVDELTGTEATALLDLFATASTVQGLVPGSNGATTTFLKGDGTWAAPAGGFADFDSGADVNVDQTVNSGDVLDTVGGTGITTTVTKAATTVTNSIALDDTAVTPAAYGLAGSVSQVTIDQQGRITLAADVAISITESQVSDLGTTVTLNADTDVSGNTWVIDEDTLVSDLDTKVPTQQSVKAYVDSAVTGGMKYLGGYNAATNTPDLDSTPIATAIGDTYTVTAAGTFFAAVVAIGDVLISEAVNATTEAEWTILEKNIPDIVSASETAEGIIEIATQGEVTTGTDDARAITPLKLTTHLGETGTLNSTVRYTAQIGDTAATTIVVTHSIGRQFVTAQVFLTATPFAQIECDIEMDTTNATSFTFNTAPGTNEFTVVIVG